MTTARDCKNTAATHVATLNLIAATAQRARKNGSGVPTKPSVSKKLKENMTIRKTISANGINQQFKKLRLHVRFWIKLKKKTTIKILTRFLKLGNKLQRMSTNLATAQTQVA